MFNENLSGKSQTVKTIFGSGIDGIIIIIIIMIIMTLKAEAVLVTNCGGPWG
jgi:hypothetical protein